MFAPESTDSANGTFEVQVVSTLCEACGVKGPVPQIRAVMAALPADLTATERLIRGARASGLRIRRGRSTVQEGMRSASPRYPSVAITSNQGQLSALIGYGVRWGKASLRIIPSRDRVHRVKVKNIPPLVGAERPNDPFEWLFVEPAYPAGPVDAPVGQKPGQRLRQLVASERRAVTVILVYAVAGGVLALATPLAIQVLISWLAFGGLLQPIVVLSGLLLVFLSFAALLRGLQRHAVEIVQRRIFVRLLTDVTQRLRRVQTSTFDQRHGPEVVNRFFDVLSLQKAASLLLVDGASAALQAAVGLLILGFYHPALLLFDLVVILVCLLVLIPLGRGAQRTAILESKRKYAAAAWVQQVALRSSAMKLNGAALAITRSDDLARDYLKDRADHFSVFFRQYVGMLGVQVVVSAALLLLSGWLVLEGQLTVGQLVAAEFIVAAALAGFGKVVDKLDTYYDLIAAVDKLGALADLPQERRVGLVREAPDEPLALGAKDLVLLGTPVSLEVAPGECVWMTVSSHLRSDLAETLVGLRDPELGTVRHDGADLRTLHPESIYAQVALVRSEDLIHGTIRDNIALARTGVDDARVWWALGKVRLADCVAGLARGLDTPLGPRGRPLSPSQVSRLMVARALAGRPRLIVVDGMVEDAEAPTRDAILDALRDGPTVVLLSTTGSAPKGFRNMNQGVES